MGTRGSWRGTATRLLIPVLLDDVSPPLGFRQLQAFDLRRDGVQNLEPLFEALTRVTNARRRSNTSARARDFEGSAIRIDPANAVVTVPKLIGSSAASATSIAKNLGIGLTIVDGANRWAEGTGPPLEDLIVTEQIPAAETQMARGDTVVLTVARRTQSPRFL
jgi:hypothetical protein